MSTILPPEQEVPASECDDRVIQPPSVGMRTSSEDPSQSNSMRDCTDDSTDVSTSDYLYVDTAVNGFNRNNVRPVSEFSPPESASNCFMTYCRYTSDLLDYMKDNLNPQTGRPSVARYPGPAYASFLPLDFDCKEDPKVAFMEAARFVREWERKYNLDPESLRIYFSGMKGVSIEVPGELFGGFEPSPDIAQHLRSLAKSLTPDARFVDTKIYEKMRLWRVPNTRHGESGLYKVQITAKELLDA